MTRSSVIRILVAGGLAATMAGLPVEAVAAPVTSTFTSPAPLYVGDNHEQGQTVFQTVSFTGGGGQATVFPTVAEYPQLARIVDVNVVIGNLTHENPDDVELVLVEKGGPQVTLMANAGGSTDMTGLSIITFDDEAADPVPDEAPLVAGTYRPATYGTVSQLPAPAPTVNGNTSLSVFDGVPTSSTWQLFAYDDDGSAATGQFTFWRLEFVYATTAYPSELNVTGAGAVQDLDVTLHGFTSTYPADLDLLLVGPTGAQVTLMSDAGGGDDPDHIELTFDDEAATELPASTSGEPIAGGRYKPTNIDDGPGDDDYPPPAPVSTGAASLGVFDGTNPNGTWRLFAFDGVDGDVTSFRGGWSLEFDWSDSVAPSGTVSVAGGAATTTSPAVILALSATDPAPGTNVTQMRFSNDGTTFSAYQPYAATAPWMLSAGDGAKTVYAQFRDGAGNVSAVAADSIVLDSTAPTAKKVRPARNAQHVAPNAKVKVVATEALTESTITGKSVLLKRNGKPVKAKVTYKPKGHAILLVPKKPLKPGRYKVKVTTAITDLAGNRFDGGTQPGAQPLRWRFRV